MRQKGPEPIVDLNRTKSFHPRALPRILVADDDRTTSELLAANKLSYRIVSVANGQEAFRILRRDANFSAAVFNMSMSHLPGLDVLKYMKAEKRLLRIPVVIVIGDGGFKLVADSFAAGAIAFLAKPFAANQLQRTLELALRAQQLEEISPAA